MKNKNIIFKIRLYFTKRRLVLCFRLQIQVQSFVSIAAKKSCVIQSFVRIAVVRPLLTEIKRTLGCTIAHLYFRSYFPLSEPFSA